MINPTIREGTMLDIDAIRSLYERVASIEGGLARMRSEITPEYVAEFVRKSVKQGLLLVAVDETLSAIVGEIHCYRPSIKVFSHILGDLTIAVDPDHQGSGIGRMLFSKLLSTVAEARKEIQRIELIARESNTKAISFYESLGFRKEGKLEQRIQSAGGGFEADIPMAWLRKSMLRTSSENRDFVALVKLLDADLAERDGEEHSFYAQFNTIDKLQYVIVAYEEGKPVGCGAFKELDAESMEVKRMYVLPAERKKGIAAGILAELEKWANELSYKKCLLETGKKQPEAIGLYRKNGYTVIPNYGQYAGVENSVCFEKKLK